MHETSDETPEIEELEQELATCRHHFIDAIKRLTEAEKRAEAAEAKFEELRAEIGRMLLTIAIHELGGAK